MPHHHEQRRDEVHTACIRALNGRKPVGIGVVRSGEQRGHHAGSMTAVTVCALKGCRGSSGSLQCDISYRPLVRAHVG